MGKLKELLNNNNHPTSLIAKFLLEVGFEYECFVCSNDDYGYQRRFSTDDGLYYVYIFCDLDSKILKIYKEFDCGGLVYDYSTNIPDSIISNDDPDEFIEWLDNECEFYL